MAETIPKDVLNKLGAFSKDLTAIEKAVADYIQITPEQRENLTPLEKARRDLTIASTVNSIYCMYSSTLGRDPQKEEEVGVEARRIKEVKNRLEELEARPFRTKINKKVARAFIRNALADTESGDHPSANTRGKKRSADLIASVDPIDSGEIEDNF